MYLKVYKNIDDNYLVLNSLFPAIKFLSTKNKQNYTPIVF